MSGGQQSDYGSGALTSAFNIPLRSKKGVGTPSLSRQLLGQQSSYGQGTLTYVGPTLPTWISIPDSTFQEGIQKDVNLGLYVTGYSASTDVFVLVGNPAWLGLTTVGGNIMRGNGTQVGTDDVPNPPGIQVGVSRSGGPYVYTASFPVTVLSVSIPLFGMTTLYDGLTGVSGTYWNLALRAPWDTPGGDWLDTSLAMNGSSPYTSAVISATGLVSWSGSGMVSLIQRALSTGNRGIMLRGTSGTSGVTFSSREDSIKPVLSVTANGIAYSCPCTADCWLYNGMGLGNGVTHGLQLANNPAQNQNAVLQFDLSAIPGGASVTAATMTLNAQSVSSGTLTVGVFELNPPTIWTQVSEAPSGNPVETGLADAFTADVGLASNPNILVAGDWQIPWKQNFTYGGQPITDENTLLTNTLSMSGRQTLYAGKFYSSSSSTSRITCNVHLSFSGVPIAQSPIKWLNTPPTPLLAGTTYYTRDEDSTSFKVSSTPGGSPITITQDKIVDEDHSNLTPSNGCYWANYTFPPQHSTRGSDLQTYGSQFRDPPTYQLDAAVGGRTTLRWEHWQDADQFPTYADADGNRTGVAFTGQFETLGKNARFADPEECFFRVTVKPEGLRSAMQGEKFACAIDGRYGRFRSSGYWDPYDGNGGNPTRGCFIPYYAHPSANLSIGATSITLTGMAWNCPQMFSSQFLNADPTLVPTTGFWLSFIILHPIAGTTIYRAPYGSGGNLPSNASGQFSFTDIIWSDGVTIHTGLREAVTTATNCTGLWDAGVGVYNEIVGGGAVNQQGGVYGYYSGWSSRVHSNDGWGGTVGGTQDTYHTQWIADQNPYKQLIPLHLYFYNPNQIGANGGSAGTDMARFTLGSRSTGYPCLDPGRWYTMEMRCKVNSLTGAADPYGNRTPVADGVIEIWVNGIKVKSLTDCVFRMHPNIKCQGHWLDFYIGGALIPWGLLEANHRTVGPYAVSKGAGSYIGPVKVAASTLPSWYQALEANRYYAIPNSDLYRYGSTIAARNAGMMGPPNATYTNGTNIAFGYASHKYGYSGGTWSELHQTFMLHGNGGSGTPIVPAATGWRGNDVDGIKIDVETPVWETMVPPTSAKRYWARSDRGSGFSNILNQSEDPQAPASGLPMDPTNPSVRWSRLCYLSNVDLWNVITDPPMPAVRVAVGTSTPAAVGTAPNVGHMYQQNQYIDSLDTYIRFGSGQLMEGDEGQSQFLDSWTWAGRTWVPGVSSPYGALYGTDSTQVSRAASGWAETPADAPWVAKDALTEEVYYPLASSRLIRWHPTTRIHENLGVDTGLAGLNFGQGTVAIDPANKRLLWKAWSYPSGAALLREYNVALTGTNVSASGVNCTITDPNGYLNVPANFAPSAGSSFGLIYSRTIGKYLYVNGDGHLYEITRTGTAAYTVTRRTIADSNQNGGLGYQVFNGAYVKRPLDAYYPSQGPSVYNRFAESLKLGAVIINIHAGDPVFIIKLV